MTEKERSFATPMMQQYIKIKKQYPDAILFFRLGDFYEMFLDDAKIGAKILGITLTARNKGKDGRIPMAGVPYHSAEGYINKLVNHGYKVAICEQVTGSDTDSKLVERDVVRVVTPSTNLSDKETPNQISEQYLESFFIKKNKLGIALVSITSGEVLLTEKALPANWTQKTLIETLSEHHTRFQPVEILLDTDWFDQPELIRNLHSQNISPFVYSSPITKADKATETITNLYQIDNLESFDINDIQNSQIAFATIIKYLTETQKTKPKNLKPPHPIISSHYMYLGRQTIRNLELLATVRSGENKLSLFNVINRTITPIGTRLLRNWLLHPLLDINQINQRLNLIEQLTKQTNQKTSIQDSLENVTDLDKSLARLSIGVGNARDLVAIKQGLTSATNIFSNLSPEIKQSLLKSNIEQIDWGSLQSIIQFLEQSILENPSNTLTTGEIIATGYNKELDETRDIAKGGHDRLSNLEKREREQTEIQSLKIGFNKVFGYYIEVSKSNTDRVPDYYTRKQTLTNAERYIIPELKEHEDLVLNAQAKANQLEYDLFQQITQKVLDDTTNIQNTSMLLAKLDVFQSLTQLAIDQDYNRPTITNDNELVINEGCHPVVQAALLKQFVPNTLKMALKESSVASSKETGKSSRNRFIVLTGANMAGKSTFIRQSAIITILAQMGSFVPAESAQIGIVDQIHTRIGAMDDLSSGLSTFMVEMIETAKIVNNLTDRSLVILDEVGRGTSTYDGIAIAWAISEHILEKSKAKTLFATHYLELTKLADIFPEASNYHLAVAEDEKDIHFIYRVKEGPSNQSYGIEVAKQAGLPPEIIERANEILAQLHKNSNGVSTNQQLRLF